MTTVTDIWTASRGNVLFVRELVLGAIDAGHLVDLHGVWRLVGPLVTTPRLAELVGCPAPCIAASCGRRTRSAGRLGADGSVGVGGPGRPRTARTARSRRPADRPAGWSAPDRDAQPSDVRRDPARAHAGAHPSTPAPRARRPSRGARGTAARGRDPIGDGPPRGVRLGGPRPAGRLGPPGPLRPGLRHRRAARAGGASRRHDVRDRPAPRRGAARDRLDGRGGGGAGRGGGGHGRRRSAPRPHRRDPLPQPDVGVVPRRRRAGGERAGLRSHQRSRRQGGAAPQQGDGAHLRRTATGRPRRARGPSPHRRLRGPGRCGPTPRSLRWSPRGAARPPSTLPTSPSSSSPSSRTRSPSPIPASTSSPRSTPSPNAAGSTRRWSSPSPPTS